jgi:signal transduction histidine kinase
MNGPLTYVLFGLERLERSSCLQDEQPSAEALASVCEGVERIRDMVRDLRVVARSDSRRRTPVDVKEVLELALRISSVSHRARARIVTRFDDVDFVQADASSISSSTRPMRSLTSTTARGSSPWSSASARVASSPASPTTARVCPRT